MRSFIPAPAIARLPTNGRPKPFWSVMIPTYNPRADYLEKALRSVLQQDCGPDRMQIEVVDDCSIGADVAAIVQSIAGDRVLFSKTAKNLGLAGAWNTCIEQSRGQWVHILHQDDMLLPGFYACLEEEAQRQPEASLLATRCFFVDEDGVLTGVTPRLRRLEQGGRSVNDFFYGTPLQCPGIAVRRAFYEAHGGFRSDLAFVLDCEMWARVISAAGGLVTSEVLACYRMFHENESGRLSRSGKCLQDIERLNQLFAERYSGFDLTQANRRACDFAMEQLQRFKQNGDHDAARANLAFWQRHTPLRRRLRIVAGRLARRVLS
jgi:glycosyltransferase involved in cell wall biosynthesis